MKYSLLILLFAGLASGAQTSTPASSSTPATGKNFPTMDLYGVVPRNLDGAGAGIGVFGPSFNAPALLGGGELRVGGDFYFASLDRHVLGNVPLIEPQTGTARVKLHESTFGLDVAARLSAPWQYKVTPYLDGFAGLRVLTAGITVTPNDYQPGYESSTSDNLDAACTFQYGGAAGVLVSLGRNVKLNAAVLYSTTRWPGMIKDISSARMQGTSVVFDLKPLPREMFMFKLGLTFRIDTECAASSHSCSCCGRSYSTSETRSGAGSGFGRSGAANRVGTGVRVTR